MSKAWSEMTHIEREEYNRSLSERTADHLKSCELSRKLKEQGVVVRTNFQCFGWVAVDDNTYDGIGSHLGRGKTEYEAIEDLMEQIRDRNT